MFGIGKPILLNVELEDKAILQQYHHITSQGGLNCSVDKLHLPHFLISENE